MRKYIKAFGCLLLAATFLISGCAGVAPGDPTDTSGTTAGTAVSTEQPGPSEGDILQATSTEPPATGATESGVPQAAEPLTTNPPVTRPPVTEPPATKPPVTEPPHTHSYTAANTEAPTCTAGGYTVYRCSCGDSYQGDANAALGHSWGEWTTTKEATTSSEGQQTRTCARCGATETQAIDKLPAPAIDLQAVMDHGNAYAIEKYGSIGWHIDYSLNETNAGFNFGTDGPAAEATMASLYWAVEFQVDFLYKNAMDNYGRADGYCINCYVLTKMWNGEPWYEVRVYYG